LFFTLFLLFIRWVPMIAISEVKGVLPEADPHFHHDDEASHEEEEDDSHAPAALAAEAEE
jgi:molybdopterin-containing oxidoreductase family membrane subunit